MGAQRTKASQRSAATKARERSEGGSPQRRQADRMRLLGNAQAVRAKLKPSAAQRLSQGYQSGASISVLTGGRRGRRCQRRRGKPPRPLPVPSQQLTEPAP